MTQPTMAVDAVAASYVDLTVAIVALTERIGGIETCLEAINEYIRTQDDAIASTSATIRQAVSHLQTMGTLLDRLVDLTTALRP